MFLNFPSSAVLTGASVAPVILVYALLAMLERMHLAALVLVIFGVGLILACLFLFRRAKKKVGRTHFKITAIESADKGNLGILILYLAPLLQVSVSDLSLLVLIPAVAIFFSFAISGYGHHFNPLLNLFKWHFYKVGTPEGVTYILVTKKFLKNTENRIWVVQLTRYTVIDVEEE